RVEARLDAERIRQLETEAGERGKAEYSLELQLTDEQGEVVAESTALYQLRSHARP
ncbi:thioesterase, partial [Pseudomonas aeruginosa]|nr:thioesterase [Pseudomonas aeruginosa]